MWVFVTEHYINDCNLIKSFDTCMQSFNYNFNAAMSDMNTWNLTKNAKNLQRLN